MAMPQITILNDLVSPDFSTSLDIQKSWGIQVLDLRQNILGKGLAALTTDEAKSAAELIEQRDMSVYCLSSGIFGFDIEMGQKAFADKYDRQLDHILGIAEILRPKVFRLLSARTGLRHTFMDSTEHIMKNHPWLIPTYQEAVDRIASTGIQVTIENEVNQCIWSTPNEIISFFRELDRVGKASLTFDVQNIWKMGTYPKLEVYRELAPLIGYYHLKGGQSDPSSGSNGHLKGSQSDSSSRSNDVLAWKSALDDASWPVAEMTKEVIRDGAVEVICLNPSHGEDKPGYDYTDLDKRNYDFVRKLIDS
jgi:sugar phosphate isomerase/epimerase